MVSPAVINTGRSIRKTYLLLTFYLIPNISSSSSSQTQTLPPVPKKVPFTVSAHGRTWQDPFHWMSKTDDPDFVNYLHQENSYAHAFMADTQNLQRSLYDEMTSRMPSQVLTASELHGSWLYYQCIPEGKEYPVFCRKLATEGNSWFKNIINFAKQGFVSDQILLDFNQIAEQHGYVDVGTCRPSPDNRYLAYTLDTTGNERYILQIKDLQKNCILIKEINNVVNLAWAKDSCTLFYTVSDENQNQRPYKVQLTKLGSDDDDVIIYTENDSRFCVDITCTKDREFVTVNSNSRTSSQVYVINASKPLSGLRIFHKRVPGVRCFVEHHRGFFYIMTNAPVDEKKLTSGNYYLARCRVEDVESNTWQIIVPPGEDVSLQDMDMFNEHIVLFVNKNGSPTICSIKLPFDLSCKKDIMNIDNLDPWYFPVPSDSCTIVPGYNHNFMSSVYRAVVSSPVMPDITVDYDMSQNTSNLVQQEDVEVISSDDEGGEGELMEFSDEYACERKEVISHDGVRIPLTIMYSRKMCQKGKSPGLLHGYGAYGEVLEKDWCPNQFSLLAAGWVFAFADVRYICSQAEARTSSLDRGAKLS